MLPASKICRDPVTTSKIPVSVKKNPVGDIKRPVTQDGMAAFIGSNQPHTLLVHECFVDELYNSVCKLIYKNVQQRLYSCSSDMEDMAQDCWVRVLKKLHLYDPKRAAFTTFVSCVCASVLNKGYRKSQKHASRYVEMPEGLNESRVSNDCVADSTLSSDIKGVVRDLKMMHPDHYDVLVAMFGKENEVLPVDINLSSIAKKTGIRTSKVSKFYHKVVRPFFVERFK